jgi:microcystin-dependent protein
MPLDPYVGEIMLFAGSYTPDGWMDCDGRTLQITQNQVLFAVISTIYGGDGQTNFKLPDLRSTFPVSQSPQCPQGQRTPLPAAPASNPGAATQSLTLAVANLPAHIHDATFTGTAASTSFDAKIPVKQASGTATVANGNMLSQGGAGGGAANIFIDPAAAGTNVPIVGGSQTVSLTATGTVAVAPTGTGQPVNVAVQLPYLSLRYVICAQGVFPPHP